MSIVPILAMALLLAAESHAKYGAAARLRAIHTLDSLLGKIGQGELEAILPGLSSRTYVMAFTRSNTEGDSFICAALDVLFGAWKHFTDRYADKFEMLLELIGGRLDSVKCHFSQKAKALLAKHLDSLYTEGPEWSKEMLGVMAFLVADGSTYLFKKPAPRKIIEFIKEKTESEEDAIVLSRYLCGACRWLWPNEPLPAEYSQRLLSWMLERIESNATLPAISKHSTPFEDLLQHLSSNDTNISVKLVQSFANIGHYGPKPPLAALEALQVSIKSASEEEVDSIIAKVLDHFEWLAGEREFDGATAMACWHPNIPIRIAQLCGSAPKISKTLMPRVLMFLLTGLASEHDLPFSEACKSALGSHVASTRCESIEALALEHRDGLLQTLSAQLACPFTYPLAPRVVGQLGRMQAEPAVISALIRRIADILDDHGFSLTGYSAVLLQSLAELVDPLDSKDNMQVLLELWDALIPHSWSDHPSVRHASFLIIDKLIDRFPASHTDILNRLHRTWPSVIALLKHSTGDEWVKALKLSTTLAKAAPSFMSDRFSKEWWPMLKSKPRVQHTFQALASVLRCEGFSFPAEQISDVFKLVQEGIDRGIKDAKEAFDALGHSWPDYSWFVLNRARLLPPFNQSKSASA